MPDPATNPPPPEEVPAASITPADMPAVTVQPKPAAETAANPAPTPAAPAPGAEVDAGGVAFDASRHLPKKHPRTGRWLPRKPKGAGRKAQAAGASVAAPTPPPPAASFIPSEPPPPPPEENSGPKNSSPPPPAAEPAADHSDSAGEVVCSVVEVVAGMAFDAPEDCTPPAAEHANMVRATAAYIRAKGWQASAGVGILLMFGAYFLRVLRKPKPQAKVREWFSAAARARDVTPPESRPAARPARQPSPAAAAVIDVNPGLPPGIPPLASR